MKQEQIPMKLESLNLRNYTSDQLTEVRMALDRLASIVHFNAEEHEFHDFAEADTHFMNRELMNLVTEATELRDAERDGQLFELCDKAAKMEELGVEPLLCIEEEYADIAIRALDQLVRLTRNKTRFRSVGDVILTKMLLNQSRPIKHGRVTA